jgi:hypothetical protein
MSKEVPFSNEIGEPISLVFLQRSSARESAVANDGLSSKYNRGSTDLRLSNWIHVQVPTLLLSASDKQVRPTF